MRDWERAQKSDSEWEAQGTLKRGELTIEQACSRFLADATSRLRDPL
jgi:hypothetical protein